MNKEKTLEKARNYERWASLEREKRYFQKTVAWFGYLGLLRHNKIKPKRCKICLMEALEAGNLEPRIFELLPAVLLVIPEAIDLQGEKLPKDLSTIMQNIQQRKTPGDYQGIEPAKYLQWIHSPIMEFARARINYRTQPRKRHIPRSPLGKFIRAKRIGLALTQQQCVDKFGLSLRVLRDLEQGKMSISVANLEKVLKAVQAKLYWH
jgi:hypothetical protein